MDGAAVGVCALVSKDGKTGLIVASITGGESDAPKHARHSATHWCTTVTV